MPEGKADVLFISSYSLDFDTVPDQIQGVKEVLDAEAVNLHYEFMNTKRLDGEGDLQDYYDQLKKKMEKLPAFDAILLADDAALTFAMEYQKELFEGIPMVFLCVNDLELARRAGENPYITGIIEEPSFIQNIELAKTLFPGRNKMVAVVDSTLTGKGDEKQFLENQEAFPELTFQVLNSSEYTLEDLGRKLREVGQDTVLFYLTMYEDKDGNRYTIDQSVYFLTHSTEAPIFRLSIGGVGNGLLGGIMVSYRESGRQAAIMVDAILNGKSVSAMDVVMKSPNLGYFDMKVINRFHIDKSLLPHDSTLVNQKLSLYQEYKNYVNIVIGVICFLILAVVFLAAGNIHRRKIMYHDFLTKLPNRMWFMEQLEKILARQEECAVFMMDLDDFKLINDSMGHALGDELLKEAARRMIEAMEGEACVARFGGDEFVGIIRSGDIKILEEKCRRLLEAFDAPFLLGDKKTLIHVSMGISRSPLDTMDGGEMIAFADAAMYSVKNTTKCGMEFFNMSMKEEIDRQEYVGNLLKHALMEDGFSVAYQPQLCSGDKKVACFEALLRLKGGEASPGEFVPVAEQNGLILPIGRWITRKVIEQMAAWKKMGYQPVSVAVNFSSVQLKDKDFPDFVIRLLEENEVSPEFLEIELTESVFAKESEDTKEFMDKLFRYGIKLSMDDFGTGYSAINYLSYVPFYKLKMDKSLLDNFLSTNDSRSLESIISLAHNMGLEITAEGVEDSATAVLLENFGCDYLQGFLFGRPGTPAAAQEYME